MKSSTHSVSVVVPTYRREGVLVDTLTHLLELPAQAAEVLVMDQTETHLAATEDFLNSLSAAGKIRWIRLDEPSIPQAMNRGLLEAEQDFVLFLDDDIRPDPALIAAHHAAHQSQDCALVAGRVLQPWDEGRDYSADTAFHFACQKPYWITQFMGGNFSVHRKTAIDLGGFDENFVRVAYRFEAEFAHRYCKEGRRIYYEPQACLHHLKVSAGGTRTYGEHLTTWRPDHAVGAYYYGLRTGTLGELVSRPWRAVATRYHLRHPWRIPVTLWAELSGMLWAIRLFLSGPRHISHLSSGQTL